MLSAVKKVLEFVTAAVAVIGVILFITFLQKYNYRTEYLWSNLTKSFEVQYHVWVQRNGRYICSGTVIHYRYILTAAECVIDSEPSTELKVFAATRTLNHGRSYDVEEIILHPSYNGTNFHRHNVALIRLATDLYGYAGKKPDIPISKKRMTSHKGLELFVTGYGPVSIKSPSVDYDQQKFLMEIVSMKWCKKIFSDVDLSGMFCAIPAPGYKPYMSDIGSPATINKTRLVGIYIGFKEFNANYAELFIDMTSHLNFIKSAIKTA